MTAGLHSLLKSERFTDLHFLCHNNIDNEDGAEVKTVWAHKAIFREHSPLLDQLCHIAEKKQARHEARHS